MLLSTHLFIATLVRCSLASSPPITSAPDTISTSIPPTITPFTLESAYLKADPCIQTCALKYSIEYSSKLSCSGDNPATCVCQGITSVISDARVCAASACPTIPTNTEYRPVVTAKALFQKHCSNQGMVFDTQTTYWTSPTPVAANIKADETDTSSTAYPVTKSAPLSGIASSTDSGLSSINDHETGLAPIQTNSYVPLPYIPPKTSKAGVNPGIIAGTTVGGVLGTICISLLYIWNKRRSSKTSDKFDKVDEPDPERNCEKVSSPEMGLNYRMSKPFDKVVEVCEAREGQPADWTRAQKTTMKIDTQCVGANYISPDLVGALNLTPVGLDHRMVITGVGDERTIIDQKVELFFRKVGTLDGENKEYPAISFCVLKKTQDFGVLLGTPDCLDLDVVSRAVLVLREAHGQELEDRQLDDDIEQYRLRTEEKKRKKRKDERKAKEKERRHQDHPDRNNGGGSGSSSGGQESGVRS